MVVCSDDFAPGVAYRDDASQDWCAFGLRSVLRMRVGFAVGVLTGADLRLGREALSSSWSSV
jgi:hypothetical protein